MRRLASILVLGFAATAVSTPQAAKEPAATTSPQTEARLFVLESRVGDLQTNLTAANVKLDKLTSDMAQVNTKLSFIQWIGSALGLLMLGTIWKLITERPHPGAAAPPADDIDRRIARAIDDYFEKHPRSS